MYHTKNQVSSSEKGEEESQQQQIQQAMFNKPQHVSFQLLNQLCNQLMNTSITKRYYNHTTIDL